MGAKVCTKYCKKFKEDVKGEYSELRPDRQDLFPNTVFPKFDCYDSREDCRTCCTGSGQPESKTVKDLWR